MITCALLCARRRRTRSHAIDLLRISTNYLSTFTTFNVHHKHKIKANVFTLSRSRCLLFSSPKVLIQTSTHLINIVIVLTQTETQQQQTLPYPNVQSVLLIQINFMFNHQTHDVLESTSPTDFSRLLYTTISQSLPNWVAMTKFWFVLEIRIRDRNNRVRRYPYQKSDQTI